MPTISQLAPAIAAGDADIIPASQAGTTRSVTRSQLLDGYQRALALAPGTLVGRSSAGVGGAEPISVAAPFTLNAGVLSGPAVFTVGGLAVGGVPGAIDGVAMSQGGRDVRVPYGAAMAGLGALGGIDLSAHTTHVSGGLARSLADWAMDAVAVEAWGAAGDGVTDDSAAVNAALASGRPVRFGAKTYIVNGQWTIAQSAVLLGVAGRTVLRRRFQVGGAWISVQGASFAASGIIFDANGGSGDSWGLLVTPVCTTTLFDLCVFQGASGPTLGTGLTIQARDGLSGSPSQHRVLRCVFAGNQVHGLWVQAASGALIDGCEAHGNGAYGLCLDDNDPAFTQTARLGRIVGCRAWGNQRGISVGNFNQTNAEPPVWGNANPDAIAVLVAGNVCHDNAAYGIAVSGLGLQVVGNQVTMGPGASGILMNAAGSRVADNVIMGTGSAFGIDAGGCLGCDVVGNAVQGCAVGVNPGGSHGMRVRGNTLANNGWCITVYNVETDGRGQNFGLASNSISIEGNSITLRPGGGGVYLVDAPQGLAVVGNALFGTDSSMALWAHTDAIVLRDNRWNNLARIICNPATVGGQQQIQVPDVLDEAMVTAAPSPVQSLMGQHQAAVAGQITYIKVQSGGSGYTQASVSVVGSGAGAVAVAYVRGGAVIGVAVTASGAGYGGSAPVVTVSGDGIGATAAASVGLPVAEGRRLRLLCNCAVRFQRAGSVPFQDNWTGTDILVPATSAVEWRGTWGGWQAVLFAPADYLAPAGDGSLVMRTAGAGDLTLRPAGTGRVRVGSDGEPFGFVVTLGHGSPEGVVVAPPGSDYRNLDGGVGTTLWVKRSGTGPVGWFAVA